MKSINFCYWLQGVVDASDGGLGAVQVEDIRVRLASVFIHEIDPSHSDDPDMQQKLQDIHDGVEEIKKRETKPGPRGPRGPSGREHRYTC